MRRLLKADWYKLLKMKSFFICAFICLALAVANVLMQNYSVESMKEAIADAARQGQTLEPWMSTDLSASNQLAGSFGMIGALFSSIVISIFAANEFGFGTMKNTASQQFGRYKIYLSKLIISGIIAMIFVLLYAAGSFLTGMILWGFGNPQPGFFPEILGIIGLQLLLNLAYASVFTMFAFLIRSTGGTVAINICLMQFFSLAVQIGQMLLEKLFKISIPFTDYLISTNMNQLTSGVLSKELTQQSLIAGIGFLVIPAALGILWFQKRDIK
jgi:ABC-2 type transport system permease protein